MAPPQRSVVSVGRLVHALIPEGPKGLSGSGLIKQ